MLVCLDLYANYPHSLFSKMPGVLSPLQLSVLRNVILAKLEEKLQFKMFYFFIS